MPTTIHKTDYSAGLKSDEIRDYFDIGWITRRGLFRPDEVARMRACFDRLEEIASELAGTVMHRGSYFVLGENDRRQIIKRVVWAGGCG